MTMSMSMTDVRAARMPAFARVAIEASAEGKLFRGFDMAVLSALFGYTAFFATFELTAAFGLNPATLLARNLFAATVSLLVNTPFQLLKTASVLSDTTANTSAVSLIRMQTNNFKNFNHLWKGALANTLSVAFIALQFTLFALFPTAGASPIQAALIGMVATSLAAVISYPVVSVKTAVMAAPENGEKCIRRIFNVARKMGRNRTLYNGVFTNVLRTTLPAFILFGVQNILA